MLLKSYNHQTAFWYYKGVPTSNYTSGDRTPKQKVKLKVTEEKLLKLMLKYNGGKSHTEVH
jgi:hypothetical protein